MVKILVTGAGGGVGQGIIKSLRLINDLEIFVISADMSPLAAGLYGGDVSKLVPAANSKEYFDRILEICEEHKVDYYFPGTDVELIKCAKFSNSLQEKLGAKIIVSPLDVIEIADDKLKTVQFLQHHGLSYPTTFLPSEVDINAINYPIIVKPRVGCRSIGVSLVHSPKEARCAIETLNDPLFQEFIDGDEYTCTVAIYNGHISEVLCLKRELRAGDTYRAFPEKNEVIEKYVRKIAVLLDINGSCNFQLRVESGIPKLFEINSRFSGTTPFCAYLGFNPVEFCIKKELGLIYNSNIQYDKIVVRHWSEVVLDKSEVSALELNGSGVVNNYTTSRVL
ncbi:ATP-grasp domain-containing protein [Vibrio tubiashii]|uniref:ATP-grasp domain-containing protein n=1 Tax=Vibrio tubiashii TaxID=29498 RepID=A0AAE5LJ79_9VIBR|nr:ATP-grasp domain-containing protein [Vibrio tubiashii]NOI82319.1 ATP-grasp domain-containing protein [Vibrio tubiashii]